MIRGRTRARLAPGERQEVVEARDGVPLRALLASPPRPNGLMVLCHGMTTDASEHGAFEAVRDLALRAGLAVARYDARAHGKSGGTNEQLRMELLRADADSIMAWVDSQLGGDLTTVPLGVSFGGAAAAHIAIGRNRCAGLAFWYAVVDYESNYGVASEVGFTQQMRAAHSDSDPPWSAMPVLGTGYHFPAAMLEEMPSDPTRDRVASLTFPVLSYYGSRDPFVDTEPLRRLAAEHPNIDFRTAWGAGHGFLLWRWWVIRRTVSWAARQTAR